jgi:flagellar hook-length control protein FliK
MLTSIAKKSNNPQLDQGDSSVKTGSPSDRELFEQFTDILDKIASSLNHAKKSNSNQVVSDMSAALGQAAAVQVQRQLPNIERPTEPKEKTAQTQAAVIEKDSLKQGAEQTLDRKVPQAQKQAPDQEAVVAKQTPDSQAVASSNQASCLVTEKHTNTPVAVTETQNAVESPVAQGEVELADNSPDYGVNLEGQVDLAEVAAQQKVQVAEKGDINSKSIQNVSSEQPSQDSSVAADEVAADEVAADEVAADEVAEAPLVNESSVAVTPESMKVQTKSAQELAATPVAETKGKENSKAVQVQQVDTAPSQVEASVTESDVTGDQAQTEEQVQLKQPQIVPQLRSIIQKTNEELITQSIEALLHQVTFAGATRSLVEAALSPQNRGQMRQPHGIQAISNNQFVGTAQADQGRQLQINREKAPVRELPRALASKTMERVESALKEVARSKDGKTISLRLDPPSLGTLKIDVTLKDGQLHARFVGESAQVNSLLREQAHDLQQMLRKAGVQAEKIIISVGNDRMTDLNEGSQTFDQQASPQFRESASHSSGFAGISSQGADSLGKIQNQQPVDHWVA